MSRQLCAILGLVALFSIPVTANAKVFMCVDPQTGKKTFTDRACPDKETGKRVKVEPVNFGDGNAPGASPNSAWASDRDTGTSGRDHYSGNQRRISAARTTGYLPSRH